MKVKITFVLFFISANLCAQWVLFRDYSVAIPGIPYEYSAALAVGGLSRASRYTWKIVNGKIRDQDGNYTLTTLEKESPHEPIFVIWDCAEMGETAEIGLAGIRSWDIDVEPCNIVISNKNYEYSCDEQGTFLTLANVKIRSKLTVNLNGYNSVRILPGFLAEQGCKVRIYNTYPSIPSPQTRSVTSIDVLTLNKAGMYQNSPNPANSMTSISFVIPEIHKDAYIQLCNMMGCLVMKIPVTDVGQNSVDINTNELPNGIYMYSLIIDDSLIDTKRMIIAN